MSEDEVVYIEPVARVGDQGDCRECKRWLECKEQLIVICDFEKEVKK